MTSPNPPDTATLRVSDGEREHVATRLRDAAAEGRLSMPEADERLAAAYAAVTRADLVPLTVDLPEPPPPPLVQGPLSPRARRRLTIHAVIVAVIAINLVVRFALSGIPFFFPGPPLLFLLATLAVHYAVARRRSMRPAGSEATHLVAGA